MLTLNLLNALPEEQSQPLGKLQDNDADLRGRYLRRDDLARLLKVSPRTIDRWHTLRQGPARITIGRTILYRIEAVDEWLRAREPRLSQPPPRKRRRNPSN